MPIRPEQLPQLLDRGELAPVYLIAGDEPLLVAEAAAAVRTTARARGFDERLVLHPESADQWDELPAQAGSLSLFASKRLIEVYIPEKGTGAPGASAIGEFLDRSAGDCLLLLIAGSLDSRQRKAAWFKRCDDQGVAVYGWPLNREQLPDWLEARARRLGLSLHPDAIALLCEFGEGNLLAAAQELDRMRLLFGDETVTVEQVREAAADSAHFDMFDLPDKALAGDQVAVIRSLERLREEGTNAVPMLWSLANQIRQLLDIAREGEAALNRMRMPPQKKRLLGQAARRADPRQLMQLVPAAAHADQANKGAADGQPWEELVTLALNLARCCAPKH